MYVVDSSGWVEYLSNGPKAAEFAKYLEQPESLLLPSVVVYEVYKKLLREESPRLAEWFLSHAFSFAERELPLHVAMAAAAARVSVAHSLAMADAIIYAAALARSAQLITSDRHFSGLPSVILI